MSTFTIKAEPGTDIWRKPPTVNIFNAPTHVPAGVKSTHNLSKLKSVTATFSYVPTALYDQAGVVLSIRPAGSAKGLEPPARWIKSGVEMLNGTPVMGTVATESWSDWSLAPVPDRAAFEPGTKGATGIRLRREGDKNGTSLWVYLVTGSGEERPLREICWVFADAPDKWDVEVEAYAARPAEAKDCDGTLEAEFESFEVEWSE